MLWNWFGLGRDYRPALFTYWDGRRKRRVDPVVAEQILARHLGHDWPAAVRQLSVPLPPGMVGPALEAAQNDRLKQNDAAVAAICEAFGVQEYGHGGAVDGAGPGAGLGRWELFQLLGRYQLYSAELMESARFFGNAQPRDSPIQDGPPPASSPGSTSVVPA